MGKTTITLGDVDFRKTLTENELAYIRGGCNWIGKGYRETQLKALHRLGWTLDEIDVLPYDERGKIWDEATLCGNNQSWERSKYKKELSV